MRKQHVAVILCGIMMLFLVALRPWLPFYADTEYSVLTVKVNNERTPVNNTRVEVYDYGCQG